MDTYQDALEIYNKLPFMDKKFVSPKEEALYRYVIKDKAFIDITSYLGNNDMGFINIAVLPQYRKQGLSKILCDKAKEDCKKLGMRSLVWKCKTFNNASYQSALSNGFSVVGRDNDELILGYML